MMIKTVHTECDRNGYSNYNETNRSVLIEDASDILSEYFDLMFPGWRDDVNMKDTPRRFTKAMVEDIASSLYQKFPKITAFDNVEKYNGIVLQSNIPVKSLCSHHLQNIYGVAHVAYLPDPDGKIIGLSKLNRIVEYYSRKPQVQENLTTQIHNSVSKLCEKNNGVAVIIKAKHMCVEHRGVNQNSDMSTCVLSGGFRDDQKIRDEFYKLVEYSTK